MLIAGIDEAGRGPPIGPMVMAGVKIKEEDEKKLKRIGVKDSKLLTKEKREELFDKIIEIAEAYSIVVIPAEAIDKALLSDSHNLNWLEADHMLEIIHTLEPEKVYLDSPSNNIPNFTLYLSQRLKIKTELVVEHKADLNYPVVAAGSILAKVTRDREIEEIKKKYDVHFGSGYASDPRTIEFIRKYYDKFPEIFRKTWASYKYIIEEKRQRKLFDFGAEKKKHPMLKKMEKLLEHGYNMVATRSPYEIARMKGEAVVILYTTGKILIQGNEEAKKRAEEIINS
jgi:ribonuclease HII